LLKAFEDGADGVCVIGCPEDECHNVMGSKRAGHRVLAVRKALEELGVEGDRIEMFYLPRGFHPEFVEAVVMMDERIRQIGASPFAGEEPVKKEAKEVAAKAGAKPAKKAVQKPAAKVVNKKAEKPAKKGGKK
jgi:hypothetical protein